MIRHMNLRVEDQELSCRILRGLLADGVGKLRVERDDPQTEGQLVLNLVARLPRQQRHNPVIQQA